MSAVIRWRCDICQREAETVQEVDRGVMAFFSPKFPSQWVIRRDGKRSLDLCSQACVVVHTQRVLTREQHKLSSTLPVAMPHSSADEGS